MLASEIRRLFLEYFKNLRPFEAEDRSHTIVKSSRLVPDDDPTLLFTNSGMVQFKQIFLGQVASPYGPRAVSAQKCVRAGGKHNDLEQVGHTARHHTFFEMLGNFSFGNYFKGDAIVYAWNFVTDVLKIPPSQLRITVHQEDEASFDLWHVRTGIPVSRIYRLGDKDNFWQMADTGPCGPCAEIYVDLALATDDWEPPAEAKGAWTERNRTEFSTDEFVEGAEAGRFLEIWNLVFMQYENEPSRRPGEPRKRLRTQSIDTGAGLERIAAVMQRVTNNYHTDLFAPLLEEVSKVVGLEYWGRLTDDPLPVGTAMRNPDRISTNLIYPSSYRVIADHARAVAFLIADGVFPANDGRGYVLRRILRRAVRHAWLLGRHEPTLTPVVRRVIESMGEYYPELLAHKKVIIETSNAEEIRFLETIDAGMSRFDQIAPAASTQGSLTLRGTIAGEDAFKLYDTYGFPIDLTELMARERGYTVDISGFERALAAQRDQSREERKTREIKVATDTLAEGGLAGWERAPGAKHEPQSTFVGYGNTNSETTVEAVRRLDGGRIAMVLRETPFYAVSGGQISDKGEIVGQGWRVDVDDVRKIEGRTVTAGRLGGTFAFGAVKARVPADVRRDTERNHTATHLLHAALREVLGEHVHQQGSLVEPDRLRFDFTHHGPVKPAEQQEIELRVNRAIWDDIDVLTEEKPYKAAVASGAMALFGEKYGDVVRVVNVPGVSKELCGGTHARNTGQIALFKIVSESGVAAGVRRIEAVTGPKAYELVRAEEQRLSRLAELLKAPADAIEKRVASLRDDLRAMQKQLDEARKGGGDGVAKLLAGASNFQGHRVICDTASAADGKELQSLGDALREQLGSGVAVVGSSLGDGKTMVLVVVTDDLKARGVAADAIVREIAAAAGGRGGGKSHMAQAGLPDAGALPRALGAAPQIVRAAINAASAAA